MAPCSNLRIASQLPVPTGGAICRSGAIHDCNLAINSPVRFRDQAITFSNGAEGRNIDIPSASPLNYYQVITAPGDMPRLTVDGKLFLPPPSQTRLQGQAAARHHRARQSWRRAIPRRARRDNDQRRVMQRSCSTASGLGESHRPSPSRRSSRSPRARMTYSPPGRCSRRCPRSTAPASGRRAIAGVVRPS